MKETPTGTPVGVDDPYEHVDRCDYVTDDGKCRFAYEHFERDREFGRARREEGYACPVVEGEWEWKNCPHFRCREHEHRCERCGLEEKRVFEERPLLEEHHLSYRDTGDDYEHEITVTLCRWCHAKIHNSGARIDDDVEPDPEALEEFEKRSRLEEEELGFSSASELHGASKSETDDHPSDTDD